MSTLIESLVDDLKSVKVVKASELFFLFLLAGIFAFLVFTTLDDIRPELQEWKMPLSFIWKIATFGLIGLAAFWELITQAIPGRGNDTVPSMVMGMGLFLLFAPLGLFLMEQPVDKVFSPAFDGTSHICVASIALSSLIGLMGAFYWLRKARPFDSLRTLWLSAVISGSVGAMAFAFICTHDSPAYVALWYTTALLIPALIVPAVLKPFLSSDQYA